MRAGLLVGNAPIIAQIPWASIPRDLVEIVGVNRCWDHDNPARQYVHPDWYCALDSSIEPCWLPPEGTVRGFPTRDKKPYNDRSDAIKRNWRTYSDRLPWPKDGEEYFRIRSTPAFAFQWMLESNFTHIGLVDIEYSIPDLVAKEQPTHAHGSEARFDKQAQTLDGSKGIARRFWTRAVHTAIDKGILVNNVNPNTNTPFHSIPFACDHLDHWLKMLPRLAQAVA